MRRRFRVAVAVATAVVLGTACGGGDGSDGIAADGADLTGAAAQGAQVAEDRGCTSCHSPDGGDKVGPTWEGLWGSEVELDDGEIVTADETYVERAITDPRDEVVAGYAGIMPEVSLSDDEVDQLVAYIEALG